MNKDTDKHKQLLYKCLYEITQLNYICNEYGNYIGKCVGCEYLDSINHFTDYAYWINLEYEGDTILNEITSHKYILKKEEIIKYMIKMYIYEYLDSLL
jgi:hypothetical protein